MATLLGVAIGVERQWRSRMAGLQTMALVTMGAVLFLIFGAAADRTWAARAIACEPAVSARSAIGETLSIPVDRDVSALSRTANRARVEKFVAGWLRQ